MKTKIAIIAIWILAAIAAYISSRFEDIPSFLPGLVLFVSRFIVPSVSRTFKRISVGSFLIIAACIYTAFIALAFHYELITLIFSLIGVVFGYVFFFSIVISDIAILFKKTNSAEQGAAANP